MPAVELREPRPSTLRRYGLTLDDWRAIADRQGRVCAICLGVPASGRLHIEHEHVRGWRHMAPDQRKRFVRGLACWRCNSSFLARGITVERAMNVVSYLAAYVRRAGTQ